MDKDGLGVWVGQKEHTENRVVGTRSENIKVWNARCVLKQVHVTRQLQRQLSMCGMCAWQRDEPGAAVLGVERENVGKPFVMLL